jgi:hypothetical protein
LFRFAEFKYSVRAHNRKIGTLRKLTMKKQWLGLTILLGLAGVVNHAHAVYVNEEGLGEVLLYPFYTVENG